MRRISTDATISIALCTFNGERFVREQLESIQRQTRRPHELIVCDDGSDDRTIEIIRSFAANSSFLVHIYVNETRRGSTKNFEHCISKCSGELIALSDQDDVWQENKLQSLAAEFEKKPGIGYVFSDAELIDEAGTSLGRTLWDGNYFKPLLADGFPHHLQISALLKCNVVTGTCMMFAADLKKLVLPISAHWIQDYWIATIASSLGWSGVSVNASLVKYRLHHNQQVGANNSLSARIRRSRKVSRPAFENRVAAYQDLIDHLRSLAPPPVLAMLEQKRSHLRNRADLRERSAFRKLTGIFHELRSGRYARFSNSWQSLIQDLCF